MNMQVCHLKRAFTAACVIAVALGGGCKNHGSAPTATGAGSGSSEPAAFKHKAAEYTTSDPEINKLLSLTQKELDLKNAFFQDLGTNGRRCSSCHLPTAAWGITPPELQAIFNASDGGITPDHLGLSAIFRPVDGANCPSDDFSTFAARQASYSLLLNKGLIRIGIPIPPNAEFTLTNVVDPYSCPATCSSPPCTSPGQMLSMYRRPLPTTNEKFISTVMWDGRATIPGSLNIRESLRLMANEATLIHAQATKPLTQAQEEEIFHFQFQNFSAQSVDTALGIGDLTQDGARGGPNALLAQPFFIGINDNFGNCIDQACRTIAAPLGIGQRNPAFNPNVFTIYNAWAGSSNPNKASVARGQALFNTKPIVITNVGGINNNPAFCQLSSAPGFCPTPNSGPPTITGGCVTCHDTPNAGDHSVVAPLNIGLADPAPAFFGVQSDLPKYTFACNATGQAHGACTMGGPSCTNGMPDPTCGSIQVTDPGRGLINGRWASLGSVKGPILRGVPARAPFFHNGIARNFGDVIDFYDDRFGIGFTAQERQDLINFLSVL